jgi:hypothetical protein
MHIARTTVQAAVIHPEYVEIREVFNDSVGFRVSLGDYRAGIRYVSLTSGGDLLMINDGAANLLLPYNPLGTMIVDMFHPGWSAHESIAGTAVVVTHRDGLAGDVSGQLAELVVRTARGMGIQVSARVVPPHRAGLVVPVAGVAAPGFARSTAYR